jgi:hypothetical protein
MRRYLDKMVQDVLKLQHTAVGMAIAMLLVVNKNKKSIDKQRNMKYNKNMKTKINNLSLGALQALYKQIDHNGYLTIEETNNRNILINLLKINFPEIIEA